MKEWIIDLALGVLIGGVIGSIVAINFIITIGIGYDTSLPDVFRESTVGGVVTVAILLAGPVGGVILVRRVRAKRRNRGG